MLLMLLLFVLMLFALWLGSRHGGLALGAIGYKDVLANVRRRFAAK